MRPCKQDSQYRPKRKSMVANVSIPFLLLGYRFRAIGLGSPRDALDISFSTLLVESIQFEAVCRWWPCGACTWNTFNSVEGMNKDSV